MKEISTLDRIVDMAVKATVEALRATTRTPSGCVNQKTRMQRNQDDNTLDVLVRVLDHAFRWHGAWGCTQFAIREHLRQLASGRGLLVKHGAFHYGLPDQSVVVNDANRV